MHNIAAIVLAALTAAANGPTNAVPGEAAEIAVTGKVVALRNLSGELAAVKLLGKDGRIYTVVLDERGRSLAAEAKRLVDVKGRAVAAPPEGDKPPAWTLTVREFQPLAPAGLGTAADSR